jgi:transcriptional repressor NrdR
MPRVIKSDGTREPFDDAKLRNGLQKALEKRPVGAEQIERTLSEIMSQLRSTGEREVESKLIGQLVMNALKELDSVAYLRFASVYLSFDDIEDFGAAIENLKR